MAVDGTALFDSPVFGSPAFGGPAFGGTAFLAAHRPGPPNSRPAAAV